MIPLEVFDRMPDRSATQQRSMGNRSKRQRGWAGPKLLVYNGEPHNLGETGAATDSEVGVARSPICVTLLQSSLREADPLFKFQIHGGCS